MAAVQNHPAPATLAGSLQSVGKAYTEANAALAKKADEIYDFAKLLPALVDDDPRAVAAIQATTLQHPETRYSNLPNCVRFADGGRGYLVGCTVTKEGVKLRFQKTTDCGGSQDIDKVVLSADHRLPKNMMAPAVVADVYTLFTRIIQTIDKLASETQSVAQMQVSTKR